MSVTPHCANTEQINIVLVTFCPEDKLGVMIVQNLWEAKMYGHKIFKSIIGAYHLT